MSIRIGDRIPSIVLTRMAEDGPQPINSADYFAGRKVVLFAVPGAFTPTCSAYHLPGFIKHLGDFTEKGIDAVGCVSVNDIFVMHAWAQSTKSEGIEMLADGNADFTVALGLEMDSSAFGMGTRSQRYALVAEDGIVTRLFIEAPGEFRVSSAESVLATL